jgi:hypothetical protein
MTDATFAPGVAPARSAALRHAARAAKFMKGVDALRLAVLWLAIYTSSIVLLDVFYNIFIMLALALFVLSGLRIDRTNLVFFLFLAIYNLGGLIALQPYTDFPWSREFVIGTAFVATTGVFFCLLMNEDTNRRLDICKSAFIIGALQASVLGIIGYFDIAGLGEVFSMYGRASGTFRDPNVFGPFLVLPALYLLYDLIHFGRWKLIKAPVFLIIMLALLLSFSRGAWGGVVVGCTMIIGLSLATTDDRRLRIRIVAGCLIFLAVVAALLAIALSFDDVAKVFSERFVLQKDYDSGPSGRFGNQIRAFPELLVRPFGYGPNRHGLFFPENPHNVYMMGFSSYGWLGGLTFIGFIAATTTIALRNAFQKTPYQMHAIVITSALIPHILQGFQIDSDRWRHLFFLYGVAWGLAAVNRKWIILNGRKKAAPPPT